MEQEILSIIENSFPIKKGALTLDTPLDEVIRDSMDFIELVAILSSAYSLNTEQKNLSKIKTIRDIAKHVVRNDTKTNTPSDKKLLGF